MLDLFAGIGGFSLGMQRAGLTVAGQCEIDPFCRAVLAKHWPNVWRHDDVRTLTGQLVRRHCRDIDVVCGGFPCQNISAAGRGDGIHGDRSGLWFDMLRIITEVRPAWVVIENVPALRSRGADDVLSGLEAAGYPARAMVVGAWAVGAPHKRDRAWIVANRDGVWEQQPGGDIAESGRWVDDGHQGVADTQRGTGGRKRRAWDEELQPHGPTSGRQQDDGGFEDGGAGELADTMREGLEGGARRRDPTFTSWSTPSRGGWPAGPGEEQHGWEAPRLVKFPLGGELDGVPVRLVRFANRNAVKAFGNSIVPQIPEIIGHWLMSQAPPP